MTRLVAAAVLALVLVPSLGRAQGTPCFNGACLEDHESSIYHEARRQIESVVDGCGEPGECVLELSRLNTYVRGLEDVPDLARWTLEEAIADDLLLRFELDAPVYTLLLRDPDRDLRHLAVAAFWRSSRDWSSEPRLEAALNAALRSSDTDPVDRVTILWAYRSAGVFDRVQDYAFELAQTASEPELARDAAQVWLRHRFEDRDDVATLQRLAVEGPALLAEEAAIVLLNGYETSGDLLPVLVARLEGLATAPGASPRARGEAVEALARHADEPVVIPSLLSLLQPENWFFGATGAHFPVHSLALLVVPLSDAPDPRIQRALRAAWNHLDEIPEEEGRDYVEWVLQNWVREPARERPGRASEP